MGKKQEVLLELFHLCQQRGQYVFDNDMVAAVCRRKPNGNLFFINYPKQILFLFCLEALGQKLSWRNR